MGGYPRRKCSKCGDWFDKYPIRTRSKHETSRVCRKCRIKYKFKGYKGFLKKRKGAKKMDSPDSDKTVGIYRSHIKDKRRCRECKKWFVKFRVLNRVGGYIDSRVCEVCYKKKAAKCEPPFRANKMKRKCVKCHSWFEKYDVETLRGFEGSHICRLCRVNGHMKNYRIIEKNGVYLRGSAGLISSIKLQDEIVDSLEEVSKRVRRERI